MEKIIIETPKQWLAAKKLNFLKRKFNPTEKLSPLYIKEEVVYEFHKKLKKVCYEVKSKKERVEVLKKNYSKVLEDVLVLTYHPDAQWLITEMPDNYKFPDTLPGVSYSNIGVEMRRLYLFKKGHPNAESLTSKRRQEILGRRQYQRLC